MSSTDPLNPYAPPAMPDDNEPRVQLRPLELPPRGPTLWVVTALVLIGSLALAACGGYLIAKWFIATGPEKIFGLAPKEKAYEPIAAAAINLVIVSVLLGFGQVKAVFFGDRVWSRMVAWGLLLASGIMFVGSYFLARGEPTDVLLVTPAVLLLWLGIVMYRWYMSLLELFRQQRAAIALLRKQAT